MNSVGRCMAVIVAALVLVSPSHAQSSAETGPEKDSAVSAPANTIPTDAQPDVAPTLAARPSES
jgi:hypothetical protein